MTTFDTSREISATIEEVFAAIGDPECLSRWWGPTGFTTTSERCDFEPGGRWSFVMHGPEGKTYPNECVFAELDPPERVVIDHTSEPNYRLTIALVPSPAGTIVSWSQTFEREAVARGLAPIVVAANEQNRARLSAEVARTS